MEIKTSEVSAEVDGMESHRDSDQFAAASRHPCLEAGKSIGPDKEVRAGNANGQCGIIPPLFSVRHCPQIGRCEAWAWRRASKGRPQSTAPLPQATEPSTVDVADSTNRSQPRYGREFRLTLYNHAGNAFDTLDS